MKIPWVWRIMFAAIGFLYLVFFAGRSDALDVKKPKVLTEQTTDGKQEINAGLELIMEWAAYVGIGLALVVLVIAGVLWLPLVGNRELAVKCAKGAIGVLVFLGFIEVVLYIINKIL